MLQICVTKCNYLKVNGKWGKVGKYWCGIDEDLITIFDKVSLWRIKRFHMFASLCLQYNVSTIITSFVSECNCVKCELDSCAKNAGLCADSDRHIMKAGRIFFAFSCKCWFICVPRYLRDCISRAWISPSFRHCLILTSSLIGIWQKFSSGLKSLAKNIHRTRIITNERKKTCEKYEDDCALLYVR